MLVAIALATLFQQRQNVQQPVLGPTLPPSCSQAFQTAVLQVEDAIQAGDYGKAKSLLWLLPKSSFTIAWDESKVPATSQADFQKARDQAIEMWKRQIPNLAIEIKPKGDVRISFEQVLAKEPDSPLVAAHVGFFREDPSDVRLDFVIGLKRGQPLQPTGLTDVFDDVAYAIGSYLGIAAGSYETYTMGHTDMPRLQRTQVSKTELRAANQNMRAIVTLEKAVREKTPMVAARSDLFVDPEVVNAPPATQGDRVELTFQITNHGTGPLTYSLFPDCGCTIVDDPGQIDGGLTKLLRVAVDTKMFTYNMTKHVVLYTNDPAKPVRTITFKIPIVPSYQLIMPDGPAVVVPKAGRKYVVYLFPTKGIKLNPLSEKLDGINGTISRTLFSGLLADPDSHEGPKIRTGYKFVVNVDGNLPPGRCPATIQIYTDNPEFSNITLSFYAQSGIIALPPDVNMGTVAQGPRVYSFVVSGPGLPFKVESASSSVKCLKTRVAPIPESTDYKVTVEYDGSAPRGDLFASVKVKTTNPKQPIIDVPFRANVQ